MKIIRKLIFFIALMSLFFCVTLIQKTYAKYISSASASANLTVARWNILLNNQDILDDSDFTDTITPVFAGTQNIKSDVIAPTAEGYFDVVLDGSDTDVSFSYTVSIGQSVSNTVDDLKITKYSVNGTEYTYSGSDITGNILLNDLNKIKSIRFFVEWDDDAATETMDNADDTEQANDGVAAFFVSVNVIQLR